MFAWWRRKIDAGISEFERKSESIENQAAQTDRETEKVEHETRDLFNRAVAETAAKIETMEDHEDRELVRALVLREFQLISLPGGPGDVSKLMPRLAEGGNGSPAHSI
jgi:hypothetical protein